MSTAVQSLDSNIEISPDLLKQLQKAFSGFSEEETKRQAQKLAVMPSWSYPYKSDLWSLEVWLTTVLGLSKHSAMKVAQASNPWLSCMFWDGASLRVYLKDVN